jgi:hypothetical protein
MKCVSVSIVVGAWVAFAACGSGGSGGKKGTTESGGYATTGGSIGNGGTGGSATGGEKAEGGSSGAAGSTSKGDASVANADQAARSDLASVGGACPAFTPCGGNLVGTWHLTSECMSATSPSEGCTFGVTAIDLSAYKATFTFTASGTVSLSVSGTVAETIRYAPACFGGDASSPQSCANFQQAAVRSWQGEADAGEFPFTLTKFDCVLDSTLACVCNEVMSCVNVTETGRYTTAGTQVTIGALSLSPLPDAGPRDAGADDPADYCVSGDTLTLRPTDPSTNFLMTYTR